MLSTACIEWSGARDKDGYGYLYAHGKTQRAHRLAWIHEYGEIKNNLWVLHRCDNPPCINIAHLFLGTAADNAHDRDAKGRTNNGRKNLTECQKGHSFTPDNTHIESGGRRRCLTCRKEKDRLRYLRKKVLV